MTPWIETIQANSRWLQMSDPGWDRAWEVIRNVFGDFDCECSCCGERWQYMGTFYNQHEFRHRCLPFLQRRIYYKVPVLVGDFPSLPNPPDPHPVQPMTAPEYVVDW